VHLLVAALLAAEGRVALVHEDVGVAGERLGAERAGVEPVVALLAQRLGVEEEGAGDGRGHFCFANSLWSLEREWWCLFEFALVWGGSGGACSRRMGHLWLRGEEDDNEAGPPSDVDPGGMERKESRWWIWDRQTFHGAADHRSTTRTGAGWVGVLFLISAITVLLLSQFSQHSW
jgi:hypothetical protein